MRATVDFSGATKKGELIDALETEGYFQSVNVEVLKLLPSGHRTVTFFFNPNVPRHLENQAGEEILGHIRDSFASLNLKIEEIVEVRK